MELNESFEKKVKRIDDIIGEIPDISDGYVLGRVLDIVKRLNIETQQIIEDFKVNERKYYSE